MLCCHLGGHVVNSDQGVQLPAGEPHAVIGLPGLNLLLRDGAKPVAARAAQRVECIPHRLSGWRARLQQPGVQHAGIGIAALQVGAQAGTVTLGRTKLKLGARKLRQAFAELLIKRTDSSSAFFTWARSHWRLGSA